MFVCRRQIRRVHDLQRPSLRLHGVRQRERRPTSPRARLLLQGHVTRSTLLQGHVARSTRSAPSSEGHVAYST